MAAETSSALEELAQEVRLTFHHLRATAEALNQNTDGISAGHRGVLESLARGGPQTVPALARARPVSRQHIQGLVDRLLELRFVETVQNPAHRRSVLVQLTPAGRRRFGEIRKRERRALAGIEGKLPETKLREAATTLRRVRDLLRPIWSRSSPAIEQKVLRERQT